MRKTMTLCRHGNSFHVTIAPPMMQYMGWKPGEELIGTIGDDKALRIVTLDQYTNQLYQAKRLEELESARMAAK